MKAANTYHVYGMGAALVDTEIEVSDADLDTCGVDKGLMTLVDENRQAELLDLLSQQITKASRACGGSAGNTIIAASYFGSKTFFSGKVANDELGNFYMQDMQKAGVATPQVAAEDGITGKCLILITPDAERSMNTFLGASESFSARELDLDALQQSEYVYIESYLVTSASGKAAAIAARTEAQKNQTKVALSFSDPGIVAHFKSGIADIIGEHIDLVFCNRDEALSYADTDDLNEAIASIREIADEVVVTLGAEGAIIAHGEQSVQVNGHAVDAVDTNGAGDMFAGAYLHAICSGSSRQQAGDFASRAAAKVVSQFGPRLKPEQYRELV